MDSNNLNQINMDDVTKGDDADVSAYSTLMTVEEGLKNIRAKSAIQNQEGFSMFDGVGVSELINEIDNNKKTLCEQNIADMFGQIG